GSERHAAPATLNVGKISVAREVETGGKAVAERHTVGVMPTSTAVWAGLVHGFKQTYSTIYNPHIRLCPQPPARWRNWKRSNNDQSPCVYQSQCLIKPRYRKLEPACSVFRLADYSSGEGYGSIREGLFA